MATFGRKGILPLAKLIAAIAMSGTTLALLPATAASAHPTSVPHGRDVASVDAGHHTITWCDREADGHRVYAQYRVEFFTITTGYDTNGYRPGCGQATDRWAIHSYRVCEKGVGCSCWKRA